MKSTQNDVKYGSLAKKVSPGDMVDIAPGYADIFQHVVIHVMKMATGCSPDMVLANTFEQARRRLASGLSASPYLSIRSLQREIAAPQEIPFCAIPSAIRKTGH